MLADPQGALDLLHPDPATGDTAHHNAGGTAGSTAGGRPKVVLYLHLHQNAVRTGTGVGRVEGLGPVGIELIRDWAGRSDPSITRVIDLDDRTSVDAYEAPERTRETVLVRDRAARSRGVTTCRGARTWTTSRGTSP